MSKRYDDIIERCKPMAPFYIQTALLALVGVGFTLSFFSGDVSNVALKIILAVLGFVFQAIALIVSVMFLVALAKSMANDEKSNDDSKD